MAVISSHDSVVHMILRSLGVEPKGCRECRIIFSVDEAVIVETVEYVEPGALNLLAEVVRNRRFRLVEEDDSQPVADIGPE